MAESGKHSWSISSEREWTKPRNYCEFFRYKNGIRILLFEKECYFLGAGACMLIQCLYKIKDLMSRICFKVEMKVRF